MRVDLRLQERKLGLSALLLLLGVALDEPLEMSYHALDAVGEQLNLLDIRLNRLHHEQAAASDGDKAVAQHIDGIDDAAAEFSRIAQQEDQQRQREHDHDAHQHHHVCDHGGLQRVQMHGFIIEIRIHVFLNEVRHDIDVVIQLAHARIISLGDRNLLHLVLEVVAKVQHAVDGAQAVLFRRRLNELDGDPLRRLDLFRRHAFGILAVDHVIVHLGLDVVGELAVEVRGGGDVVEDGVVLEPVSKADAHDKNDDQHQRYRDDEDHLPELFLHGCLYRFCGLRCPADVLSHRLSPLRYSLGVLPVTFLNTKLK